MVVDDGKNGEEIIFVLQGLDVVIGVTVVVNDVTVVVANATTNRIRRLEIFIVVVVVVEFIESTSSLSLSSVVCYNLYLSLCTGILNL